MKETLEKLECFIGKKTGIIHEVYEYPISPGEFGVYHFFARCANNTYKGGKDYNGTAVDRTRAKIAAVGEAIERYALRTYDKEKFIFAKYGEVYKEAAPLENFALFSESQYRRISLSTISKNVRLNWIWGYSLSQKKEILIPACFVFTPYRFTFQEDQIIMENTSAGTAAGSSWEQAVLSGIYEVIERDAIMIMWLNRLSMPRMDLDTCSDIRIKKLKERILRLNFDLNIINITMDIGIPTFFGLLNNNIGQEPITVVSAAANINPEVGILKVIEELAKGQLVMKIMANRGFNIANFKDIKNIDDHGILYSKVDLRPQVEFIKASKVVNDINELPDRSTGRTEKDIERCINIFLEKGMDIMVIDITTPEIKENDFHVVRIVIPGMVPINGIHEAVHLGGKRLYEVPYNLQYTEQMTEENNLNLYFPHPFP